ncbi:MAG: hypothetical protein K1X94_35580, partial [Sandaracinaceae bacterium]|nr:hypothetical protein [Sandaracinaceae bacterium]
APFPALAPPERLDFALFADLDRVLERAVETASDPARARRAATAVRRVVGLRAVRALHGPVGFPYFYDDELRPDDPARKARTFGDRKAWLVTAVDPLGVTVEGPRLLHVFSHGLRRDEDESVELRVLEGTRERATSSAHTPRVHEDVEQADTVPLRRALVYVPPGRHVYRVVGKGGAAFVSLSLSKPVVHLEDAIAGQKSEAKQLSIAREDCTGTLCLVARALSGDDRDEGFDAALEKLEPGARRVIAALSGGAPRDPSLALELDAAAGDDHALSALGDGALRLLDDTLRGAWLRGTLRGTRWVVTDERKDVRWLSLLFDRPGCDQDSSWTEIGREERALSTSTWRGAPSLSIVATLGGEGAPVRFEVDGTTLVANPSAAVSKWHVVVRGERARARRLDGGTGRLFALDPAAAACGAHFGWISAPRRASETPTLDFAPGVRAPGAEVWLREGTTSATLELVSAKTPDTRATLVVSARSDGFVAVDGEGQRWIRATRVALPAWAAGGVVVHARDPVAVRALLRGGKTNEDAKGSSGLEPRPELDAEPLDEARLIAISRAILASEALEKGNRFLERALMLAAGGEARAAYEDARAAALLGVTGPKGEDAVAYVKALVRPKPKRALSLPAGVAAFGLEPDFDEGAPRCGSGHGPRAELAEVIARIKQATGWDPSLAVRAMLAVENDPVDPRGPSVLARALAGSRWEIPKSLDLLKVQRPHRVPKEGTIDPDGDLRARIGAGQPFDRASYATITDQRPARAALTALAGAKVRVEFACVPRSPAEVVTAEDARCPFTVTLNDGAPLRPTSGTDGRGSLELAELPAKGPTITLGLDASPARWTAIARLVLDREAPGTTHVDGVGWVLLPPGLQWRWLLKADQDIVHTLHGPGLVRIDALGEPDESPKVIATLAAPGEQGVIEKRIALDGTPTVLAAPKGGTLRVHALDGAATITLAERVPRAAPDAIEADPILAEPELPATPSNVVTTSALLDGGDPRAPWFDTASHAERPLTPFEDSFGTLSAHGLVRSGTFREGDPASSERDTWFEQRVGYRRRLESIGLWTGLSASLREHQVEPSSWTAQGFVWTHIPSARLRFAGFGELYGQEIGSVDVTTARLQAYAEWSARVTPSFYLLPRLGYDGFYTSLDARPSSLAGVDDDVFNDFRFRRPTLVYQQLLAWWVPFLNDVFFLRGRLSEDARHGVSHGSVRPGMLFAFGDLELGTYADATWYRAAPGLRASSKADLTGVAYALFNLWASPGSLDVQPGVGARARLDDGGFEVWALVNVIGSFRRGLRDFASPELAFPEQLGGNVPWRGPAMGGMR